MKEIELTRGYQAIVDDEDFEWLNQYAWHIKRGNNGAIYVVHTSGDPKDLVNCKPTQKSTSIAMHQMILPGHPMVDHINHLGTDNQRHNLRGCTLAQNGRNKRKVNNPNFTSKYKGCFWCEHVKMWRCKISFDNKVIELGYFKDELECAYQYDKGVTEFHKEFAYLNFPDKIYDKLILPEPLIKTSSYIGVSYDKSKKRWVSAIKKNKGDKKNIKLGHFHNEKDAAVAREIAVHICKRYDLKLNFPEKTREELYEFGDYNGVV